MSLTMTAAEREAYLAGLHVGVVCVAGEGGRAPLAVPIWYTYEPGGLLSFITAAGSRKTAALRAAGRVTMCVQDEAPPYSYVSVEGPVVAIEPTDEDERRQVARRYLGEKDGDAYIDSTPSLTAGSVAIRMRPEHWLSVDYGKAGG